MLYSGAKGTMTPKPLREFASMMASSTAAGTETGLFSNSTDLGTSSSDRLQ
jgi:hypothetical protein